MSPEALLDLLAASRDNLARRRAKLASVDLAEQLARMVPL